MKLTKHILIRPLTTFAALALLAVAMRGTWQIAIASPVPVTTSSPRGAISSPLRTQNGVPRTSAEPALESPDAGAKKSSHKNIAGKLNLNTASEDQLMLLPAIGPSKAERIVTWRKKNGSFKRIADLRRVKGFGYKTFKRLEPFLDIKGDTTLAAK